MLRIAAMFLFFVPVPHQVFSQDPQALKELYYRQPSFETARDVALAILMEIKSHDQWPPVMKHPTTEAIYFFREALRLAPTRSNELQKLELVQDLNSYPEYTLLFPAFSEPDSHTESGIFSEEITYSQYQHGPWETAYIFRIGLDEVWLDLKSNQMATLMRPIQGERYFITWRWKWEIGFQRAYANKELISLQKQ